MSSFFMPANSARTIKWSLSSNRSIGGVHPVSSCVVRVSCARGVSNKRSISSRIWFRPLGRGSFSNFSIECSGDETFSFVGQSQKDLSRHTRIDGFAENHFQGVTGSEIPLAILVLFIFPSQDDSRNGWRPI